METGEDTNAGAEQSTEEERVLAVCTGCGTPYPAYRDPEGGLRLIGTTECSYCSEYTLKEFQES